jgi:hypothetical protein
MGLDQDRMSPREVDIPKYEFDLSQRFSLVPTLWQKDAGAKRPIFMLVNRKARFLNPDAMYTIEGNPDADVVVGYLEYESF